MIGPYFQNSKLLLCSFLSLYFELFWALKWALISTRKCLWESFLFFLRKVVNSNTIEWRWVCPTWVTDLLFWVVWLCASVRLQNRAIYSNEQFKKWHWTNCQFVPWEHKFFKVISIFSTPYIGHSIFSARSFIIIIHPERVKWKKRTPWKVGMLCVFLDFLIEIPFAKSIDLVIVFQMS